MLTRTAVVMESMRQAHRERTGSDAAPKARKRPYQPRPKGARVRKTANFKRKVAASFEAKSDRMASVAMDDATAVMHRAMASQGSVKRVEEIDYKSGGFKTLGYVRDFRSPMDAIREYNIAQVPRK